MRIEVVEVHGAPTEPTPHANPTRPAELIPWLEGADASGCGGAYCWVPVARRAEFESKFAPLGFVANWDRSHVSFGGRESTPPPVSFLDMVRRAADS